MFTGSLSGTGASAIQPNGTSYASTKSGSHRGCLTGPATVDFDLYLDKRSTTGSFTQVARSIGTTSTESITYNGTPGTYRWRIVSYRGSGAYTLWITKPS